MSAKTENLEGFGIPATPIERVLGTFDHRLTIFDQQVRALNLAHRLHTAKVIPDTSKPVVVIGGGIAGLTFAAGCIWLGQPVVLVERQPVPCHLQRGCDIRWVHPHIYHWPRAGAEQPYAGLPLLSWVEGTASEVARQIVAQWEKLAAVADQQKLLTEFYSASHQFLRDDKTQVEIQGSCRNKSIRVCMEPLRVVYAVGFGVEESHSSLKPHSYWENDSFNQLMPDHPQGSMIRWLVCGMGDGGVLDLQRLCIESFRQGRVVEELFADQRPLVNELRDIDEECKDSADSLYKKLDQMRIDKKFETVDERLRDRRRKDTAIILNGRIKAFPDAFDQSRASFLNRFVLHRLYALNAFEYVPGEIWRIERHRSHSGRCYRATVVHQTKHTAVYHEFDKIVIRFGTRRNVWLEEAGYGHCETLKRHIDGVKSFKIEWVPGWWSLNVNKELLIKWRPPAGPGVEVKADQREYVAPVTEAIATAFVSTVAGLLGEKTDPGKRYRITLHRVVPLNGHLVVQQIAGYAGTRPDDTPGVSSTAVSPDVEGSATQLGTVGRIFDINHLTIGLCVRSRRPCLLRSKIKGPEESTDLKADMEKLFITPSHARHMKSTVRSVLTIPMFSATKKLNDYPRPNLVFYADSDECETFTPDVMKHLHLACASFCKYLDAIAAQTDGNYRIIEWDSSNIGKIKLDPPEKSIQDLTTYVNNHKAYGSLLKADNTPNIDNLKFKFVDEVDVVPRTP